MRSNKIGTQIRYRVKERAKYCCEYCISQENYSPDTCSVEHIFAKIKGGTDHLDNLANACQGCNNHKFTSVEATDSLTGEIVPLYHPRLHNWYDHFG